MIIEKKLDADTIIVNISKINTIVIDHETTSDEKQILYTENQAIEFVQPLGINEFYEPEFIIVLQVRNPNCILQL